MTTPTPKSAVRASAIRLFQLASALALAAITPASASLVFVLDDAGNVGKYDTVAGTTTAVGSLLGGSQQLGLAYDPGSGKLLLLDRFANTVHSMDPGTGATAFMFSTTGSFQGGAVSGGLLYGIEENTMLIKAYDMTGSVVHSGSILGPHSHSTGVNASGQVHSLLGDNNIYNINADGTLGGFVVAALGLPEFVDDVDGFGSNYLATAFSNQEIWQIDGTTGVSSLFLSSAQLAAMGVGNATGVAVIHPNGTVPDGGSTVALLALATGVFGFIRRRQRA